jgi:hypothetical protein
MEKEILCKVDLPKGYEGYELNVKKMRRSHKEKSA